MEIVPGKVWKRRQRELTLQFPKQQIDKSLIFREHTFRAKWETVWRSVRGQQWKP